jgi:regulator of replication initiation timing
VEICTFETSSPTPLNRLSLPVLVTGLLICLLAVPQQLFSQVVKEKFDKLMLSENFDSINTYWTTLANAENLFIVQDGEYILQRKAPSAPYAIIANFEEEFSDFRVVASMKLDKSMSDDATVGFLFMMQPEGQGGFLCEINKKKEFRLRQIVNGSYKYLTGNSKDGGWVRNSALNETNFSNMIEIRTFNRNYDLYINSEFILSFAEPTYKTGKMGLIIGPASRGKIDFIYVFTITTAAEAAAIANTQKGESSPSIGTGPDMIELAESIIKLKTQINGLNEENEDLRKTISAMKTGDQERDVTIKNMEKQVKNLQDQIKKKEFSMDSLAKVNTELLKYKEMVGGNENADLVITLSKAVKAEKEKSTQLEQENKELREKLGLPKTNGTKPAKPNSGSGTTPPAPKKEPNVFSLPKDN